MKVHYQVNFTINGDKGVQTEVSKWIKAFKLNLVTEYQATDVAHSEQSDKPGCCDEEEVESL